MEIATRWSPPVGATVAGARIFSQLTSGDAAGALANLAFTFAEHHVAFSVAAGAILHFVVQLLGGTCGPETE
jgi:hypothetical protein